MYYAFFISCTVRCAWVLIIYARVHLIIFMLLFVVHILLFDVSANRFQIQTKRKTNSSNKKTNQIDRENVVFHSLVEITKIVTTDRRFF